MASGIEKSGKKIAFANNISIDRTERIFLEDRELLVQKGIRFCTVERLDHKIRKSFQKNGHKAPDLRDNGQADSESFRNRRIRTIKALQESIEDDDIER